MPGEGKIGKRYPVSYRARPDPRYFDTETHKIVTTAHLVDEYEVRCNYEKGFRREYVCFADYLNACMANQNGTLIQIVEN